MLCGNCEYVSFLLYNNFLFEVGLDSMYVY